MIISELIFYLKLNKGAYLQRKLHVYFLRKDKIKFLLSSLHINQVCIKNQVMINIVN